VDQEDEYDFLGHDVMQFKWMVASVSEESAASIFRFYANGGFRSFRNAGLSKYIVSRPILL